MAAPLPQPTPYTCPNCGAGLAQRAEFCPRCGARLELGAPQRGFGFHFVSALLALSVLAFGAVGACSGLVTYSTLAAPNNEFGGAFLVISIPLLVMGLAGVYFGARALKRRARK